MDQIGPELKNAADLLKTFGDTPKLIIECYSDTLDADIDTLTSIGKEAGFQIIETERHSWPSPRAEVDSE